MFAPPSIHHPYTATSSDPRHFFPTSFVVDIFPDHHHHFVVVCLLAFIIQPFPSPSRVSKATTVPKSPSSWLNFANQHWWNPLPLVAVSEYKRSQTRFFRRRLGDENSTHHPPLLVSFCAYLTCLSLLGLCFLLSLLVSITWNFLVCFSSVPIAPCLTPPFLSSWLVCRRICRISHSVFVSSGTNTWTNPTLGMWHAHTPCFLF